MLMTRKNEAPEVHKGSGRREKWPREGHRTKGIILKRLGRSKVFCLRLLCPSRGSRGQGCRDEG